MGPGEGADGGVPFVSRFVQYLPPSGNEDCQKGKGKKAMEEEKTASLVVKWVPGSAFPAENTWEKKCSEAVTVVVEKSLFADDTTAVGEKQELKDWRKQRRSWQDLRSATTTTRRRY